MKKQKHFVATSDRETYEKLKELGFQEINFDGQRWFFLNPEKSDFSLSDVGNVQTTNILHF